MSLPAVIETRESLPAPRDQQAPPVFLLLQQAIDKGIGVDALEKLQTLYERETARQAAAEFAEALNRFQQQCPQIAKNKKTDYASRTGGRVQYDYADLPQIAETIAPHLKANGLGYTWDSEADKGQIRTTCHLRHLNGHRESASFTCPVESGAGMGEQQKYAAALSFGRRMSLIQVLGLTTTEAERVPIDPTPVTEEQAADIEAKADELKVPKARLLKFLKVQSFAEIPAVRKIEALAAIEEFAARASKARQ